MFIFNSAPMVGAEGPLLLPNPGERVNLSAPFNPPVLKGILFNSTETLSFDFILDQGSKPRSAKDRDKLKDETHQLVDYFLAALTVPQKDWWVNLSPYEKDRIIPPILGQTQMGLELLSQDYILKQVTASSIYPEGNLGKKFWSRVYQEAQLKYGSSEIPVNTFNKVWIVPGKTVVYESPNKAFIGRAELKVMLEEDYLALVKNNKIVDGNNNPHSLSSQLIRDIIIPELTKEVNEGANFARLRQVYHAMILATWYKDKIKQGLLNRIFVDQQKIKGINITARADEVYMKYIQSCKKGVYNYIKQERDHLTQTLIPRKYFSGGVNVVDIKTQYYPWGENQLNGSPDEMRVSVKLKPLDTAMTSEVEALNKKLYLNALGGIGRWTWYAKMMGFLEEKPEMYSEIIPHITVVFELMKQGIISGLGDPQGEDFDDMGGLIRVLDEILAKTQIPFLLRRKLLRVVPLAQTTDVELLRHAATALGDYREEIHNFFMQGEFEKVVQLREEIKRKLQLSPNDEFQSKKLKACEECLRLLRKLYGEDREVEWQGFMFNAYERIGPSAQEIFDQFTKCYAQSSRSLDVLKAVVDMRNLFSQLLRTNGLIQKPKETFPTVYTWEDYRLDLSLEQMVHQIYLGLDQGQRNSIDVFLVMLNNIRANGYSEDVVDGIIKEINFVLQQPDTREKSLKMYALVKKVENLIIQNSEAILSYQKIVDEVVSHAKILKPEELKGFLAGLLRRDTVFLLSQMTERFKKRFREEARISGWEVVVPGDMKGKLKFVSDINEYEKGNVGNDVIMVVQSIPLTVSLEKSLRGVIVLEDTGVLSHGAVSARARGIPFYYCPDAQALKKLEDKNVHIVVSEHNVAIEEVDSINGGTMNVEFPHLEIDVPKPNVEGPIVDFPPNYSPDRDGIKGANQAELDVLFDGQSIAKHIDLNFSLYEQVLQSEENIVLTQTIHSKIQALSSSEAHRSDDLSQLRNLIETLHIPPDLLREIQEKIISNLGTGVLYFRSSTNAEDLKGYSAAGLYHSVPAVDPNDLQAIEAAIKKVWAGLYAEAAYKNRRMYKIPEEKVRMSILVQQMIPSDYSFVIHTQNPSNPDEVLIELVNGLGESLMTPEPHSGNPHRFVYNTQTGEIKVMAYANKLTQKVLVGGKVIERLVDYTKDIFYQDDPRVILLLRKVFSEALMIKNHFNFNQDIEGCVRMTTKGDLLVFYVQSRPQQGTEEDYALNIINSPTGGIDLSQQSIETRRQSGGFASFVAHDADVINVSIDGFSAEITSIAPYNISSSQENPTSF